MKSTTICDCCDSKEWVKRKFTSHSNLPTEGWDTENMVTSHLCNKCFDHFNTIMLKLGKPIEQESLRNYVAKSEQ